MCPNVTTSIFWFIFNFHKTMNVEFLNAVLAKKYLYVYRFWCLLLKLIQNLSRSCFKGFLNISHRNWWKLIICFPKEFIFFPKFSTEEFPNILYFLPGTCHVLFLKLAIVLDLTLIIESILIVLGIFIHFSSRNSTLIIFSEWKISFFLFL